ncbi:MAG: T9SS type A sorting domain-containing protein, partial [Candidatus Kapabacteria bacterium]|nr:T9SS type A sorting domain-containing protein [Candidatus Kapabacteria bacterium]
ALISYESNKAAAATVSITGVNGQTVYSSSVQSQPGENIIALDFGSGELGGLAAGAYLLRIETGTTVVTKRLVIER